MDSNDVGYAMDGLSGVRVIQEPVDMQPNSTSISSSNPVSMEQCDLGNVSFQPQEDRMHMNTFVDMTVDVQSQRVHTSTSEDTMDMVLAQPVSQTYVEDASLLSNFLGLHPDAQYCDLPAATRVPLPLPDIKYVYLVDDNDSRHQVFSYLLENEDRTKFRHLQLVKFKTAEAFLKHFNVNTSIAFLILDWKFGRHAVGGEEVLKKVIEIRRIHFPIFIFTQKVRGNALYTRADMNRARIDNVAKKLLDLGADYVSKNFRDLILFIEAL